MTNVINTNPFLRTSRQFPLEPEPLAQELGKSYIDIASAVNNRIIGAYTVNRSSLTGENWYLLGSQRNQSLRQVYIFTGTSDIPLGFKITSLLQFSKFYGIYTDGSSWYGLNGGTSVAIAGQITFYVIVNGASTTSDTIRFATGAGAPSLTNGTIVLEWLSQA